MSSKENDRPSTGGPWFKVGGPSLGVLQFWSKNPPPIERQAVHSSYNPSLNWDPMKFTLALLSAVPASETITDSLLLVIASRPSDLIRRITLVCRAKHNIKTYFESAVD